MSLRRFWIMGPVALFVLPVVASGQGLQEGAPQDSGILTLFDAVSMALQHHPAIGEARAQTEAASGTTAQSKAARLPFLSAQASLARYQEPSLISPLHSFDPATVPDFDRNLSRGNLTLSYTLYDGGGRGARIGRAESGEAMAAAGETATQMDITARVTGAFLDLLTTEELLQASEAQMDALTAEEERVQAFLAEGKAARVDLLRVQAALSRSEATAISLRSNLDVARGRLARLTGLPSEDLRGRRLMPVYFTSDRTNSRSVALEKATDASPELAFARHQLTGASAGVREAKANWFPQLQAAGSYFEYGALGEGHTFEWQGSVQLSYPLFTGGARKGGMERANAQERQASEALRRTELAVEEGVEEALAALVEARAVSGALERGVTQAEEVARIEALALEVGSGVQTDFLTAQAELFQSRAALAQARHGEVLAGIQLVRTTGELDLDWLRDNMEVVR